MSGNVSEATLMLDRERHWRFDGNAMCALAETDIDLDALGNEKVPVVKKLPALRAILWAGLVTEDPQLTLQQVGAMIHPGNLDEITVALNALGQQRPMGPDA